MNDKLCIDKIKVIRAPGFASGEFPDVPHFTDGLNVVTGPNGSGKTTLSRAISGSLWNHKKEGYEVESEASCAEKQYSILLYGRSLSQKNKKDLSTGLPALVDGGNDIYSLSIVDLLQNSEKGSVFAEKVKGELYYGIDVSKAAADAGCKPTGPKALSDEYKAAQANLTKLQYEQAHGTEVLERIHELETLSQSIPEIRLQSEQVSKALEFQKQKALLDSLEARKSSFPENMDRITSDTMNLYKTIRHSLDDSAKKLESERQEQEDNDQTIAGFSIPESLRSDSNARQNLELLMDELRDAKRNSSSADDVLFLAQAECSILSKQYSWLGADLETASLQEKATALKKVAQDSERARGNLITARQTYDELKANAPSAFDQKQLETLQADRQAISQAMKPSRSSIWIPICIAAVGIVLAAVLGSWIAGAATAIAVALYSVLSSLKPISLSPILKSRNFDGVTGRITEQMCLDAMSRIGLRIDSLLADQQKLNALENARIKLEEAQRQFDAWRKGSEEAAEALGINASSPSFETGILFNFSSEIIRWQNEIGKRDKAEKIASDRKSELESLIQKIGLMLETDLASYEAALVQAKAMADQLAGLKEAEAKQQQIARLIESDEHSLCKAKQDMGRFWEQTGIADGDEQQLSILCSELDDYTKVCNQIAQISLVQADDELCSLDSTELQARKEELEKQIADSEFSMQELGSLKTRYKGLIDSSAVSEAKLDLERKRQKLSDSWEEYAIATAVGLLSAAVESESQKTDCPAILSKASAWMKTFTSGQHDISFSDSQFRSYDAKKDRTYLLDELSSGTRVQMLLSLRLAAIELAETTVRYPLIFDELMATSDEPRTSALCSAISEIAKSRQVFYFTAQDDEYSRLAHSCPNCNLISIGGRQNLTEALSYEKKPEKVFLYPACYGQWMKENNIPSGTLFTPIAQLPCWFLFESSEELAECLDAGLEHVYQAANSVRYSSDEDVQNSIKAMKFAQRRAERGRSKPVTEAVLHGFPDAKPGAKYWNDVLQMARDCEPFDGKAFIDKLKSDSTKKLRDLAPSIEAYLQESSYYPSGTIEDNALILEALHHEELGIRALSCAKRYLELFCPEE